MIADSVVVYGLLRVSASDLVNTTNKENPRGLPLLG